MTDLTHPEIEAMLAVCDAATPDWSLAHQVNSADARTEDFVSVGRSRRWHGKFADCLFALTARTEFPRVLKALLEAREDTERLLNVARGCHDYGGGYHEPPYVEVYHHGIQTVINALESAAKERTFQTNVLERIGADLHRAAIDDARGSKG